MHPEEVSLWIKTQWDDVVWHLKFEFLILVLTAVFYVGRWLSKGKRMLEGKEFEQKLGEYGTASVDVTPELKLKLEVGIEVDLVGEVKKIAAKTATPIDDQAIAWIEGVVKAHAAQNQPTAQVEG